MSLILQKIIDIYLKCYRRVVIAIKGKPSELVFKQRFIGHARYHCQYAENSLQLYDYLVNALHYEIIECDIQFDKKDVPFLAYNENEICNKSVELIEMLDFAKENGVVVMLDFLHTTLNFKRCCIIYNLLCKKNMKSQVILADARIPYFAILYPFFTYQIELPWSVTAVEYAIQKKMFGNIILSLPYKGENVDQYEEIIDLAHYSGVFMKVSVVNDKDIAKRFIDLGTDLIITDEIVN